MKQTKRKFVWIGVVIVGLALLTLGGLGTFMGAASAPFLGEVDILTRASSGSSDTSLPGPANAPVEYKSVPGAPPAPPAAQQPRPQPTASAANSAPNQIAERMIIRTANVVLLVKDAEVALENVKTVTAQLGGFVTNSQATRVSNKDQVAVNVTVRVPADKFDEALRQIKKSAIKVNSENINSQDVSEEYVDVSAQVRNLEAVEKELLTLLTTVRERTNKAEDILAVQRELNNVRAQIERLKGRIQFLERSTALSTITLRLTPEALEPSVVQDDGWDAGRIARDALRSLVSALQVVASVGIYLMLYVLPLVLLFALPVALVMRWVRGRPKARA